MEVITGMKYFLAVDQDSKRHIIAAKDTTQAENILLNSQISLNYIYEINAETFDTPGFLMSDS